jgi:hypothetical protein
MQLKMDSQERGRETGDGVVKIEGLEFNLSQ